MDYLSVICAPYVGARPKTQSAAATFYYHGTCVTSADYKMLWDRAIKREFFRPNLCEMGKLQGLQFMPFGARGNLPVCDKCHNLWRISHADLRPHHGAALRPLAVRPHAAVDRPRPQERERARPDDHQR